MPSARVKKLFAIRMRWIMWFEMFITFNQTFKLIFNAYMWL